MWDLGAVQLESLHFLIGESPPNDVRASLQNCNTSPSN